VKDSRNWRGSNSRSVKDLVIAKYLDSSSAIERLKERVRAILMNLAKDLPTD
jgi:hypothetical protein